MMYDIQKLGKIPYMEIRGITFEGNKNYLFIYTASKFKHVTVSHFRPEFSGKISKNRILFAM